MRFRFSVILAALAALLLRSPAALADAATLHIDDVVPPVGAHPNPLTSNAIFVYQNQGGARET